MDFGLQLRKLRIAHNYSQEHVACCLNISRQAYVKWEKNQVNLNFCQIKSVCELYDIYMISFISDILMKEADHSKVFMSICALCTIC